MVVRIWLDDVRPAPLGYVHCKSVNTAKKIVESCEANKFPIEVIDCDHDLGDYFPDGGDGIRLLDWLEERKTYYPIKIHTMNPVGRQNMQVVVDRLKQFQ